MSDSTILGNPRSDRVRSVRGLLSAHGRKRHRRFLAEGPQAAREAVRFAPVTDLYLSEEAAARYPEIGQAAGARSVRTHLATGEVIRAISPDSQGVIAVVELPGNRGLELITGQARPRLVAVFSELQDPGNAGTAIRAADAAGADAVVLSAGSAEVTNPKVVRASAGSLFHLPVITGQDLPLALPVLKAAGLQVLAADARGEVSLSDVLEGDGKPVAWLFGNEARGLGPALLAQADATVRIPMPGRAESLNLAQAATLCLFAAAYAQGRAGD